MISDNNTNLNLSYHPPNPCLLDGLDNGQYKDIYSPVTLKCTQEFCLDDSDIKNLAEKDRAEVAMQNTIVKLMGYIVAKKLARNVQDMDSLPGN